MIDRELGLAATLSALLSGVLTYFAALYQFRRRIDSHELTVENRLNRIEQRINKLDRRSVAMLQIMVDVANKQGVMNRITDQLGDLLLEEAEGK